MTVVTVIFQYDESSFDRQRLEGIAGQARSAFEGLPGLRLKAFAIDEAGRRAVNVYLWESADAAQAFFGDELRERVTGLYGVAPTIAFLEVAELVDNAAACFAG